MGKQFLKRHGALSHFALSCENEAALAREMAQRRQTCGERGVVNEVNRRPAAKI